MFHSLLNLLVLLQKPVAFYKFCDPSLEMREREEGISLFSLPLPNALIGGRDKSGLGNGRLVRVRRRRRRRCLLSFSLYSFEQTKKVPPIWWTDQLDLIHFYF